MSNQLLFDLIVDVFFLYFNIRMQDFFLSYQVNLLKKYEKCIKYKNAKIFFYLKNITFRFHRPTFNMTRIKVRHVKIKYFVFLYLP